MTPITFITGSDSKFEEASAIIPELRRRKLDLDEIQSLDPQEIITRKLQEAARHQAGHLVVEDTSLCLEALGGKLPGPLVKWFIHGMGGCAEAYRLVDRIGLYRAEGRCVVGFLSSDDTDARFFEGVIHGTIVAPRETGKAFGWDPIFLPDGNLKTFSEMAIPQKNAISHRAQAFDALKGYLDGMRA